MGMYMVVEIVDVMSETGNEKWSMGDGSCASMKEIGIPLLAAGAARAASRKDKANQHNNPKLLNSARIRRMGQ